MARSPSADGRLTATDAATLLDVAEASVVEGLRGEAPDPPTTDELPTGLRPEVGVFVTLTVRGSLNGCIGTIEGAAPLGREVHRLARAAAFSDPRLPPLTIADYEALTIEVSVLSPLSVMRCASREELLTELRVGIDGLVITAAHRQGVFLPSVWDQIPEPEAFLDHLRHKAGINGGRWPRGMRAARFSVEKYTRSTIAQEPPRHLPPSPVT